METNLDTLESPYIPVEAETLLTGINDWRNTQDIVRLTFKALSDVVKAQGIKIHQLEHSVFSRGRNYHHSEFESKITEKIYRDMNAFKEEVLKLANDFAVTRSQTETMYSKFDLKTSRQDVKKLIDEYCKNPESQFGVLEQLIEERPTRREFNLYLDKKSDFETVSKMKNQVKELKRKISEFSSQRPGFNYESNLTAIGQLQQQIEDISKYSAKQTDIEKLTSLIMKKTDTHQLSSVLADFKSDIEALKTYKSPDFESKFKKFEEKISALKQLLVSNTRNILETTQTIQETLSHDLRLYIDGELTKLSNFPSYEQLKEDLKSSSSYYTKQILNLKEELTLLLDSKVSIEDFRNLGRQRSPSPDVKRQLDHKVGFEDLMNILNKLKERLQLKVEKSDLYAFTKQESEINETLCAESCVARWIWKTGQLEENRVLWEVEAVNTYPDNFLWSKGSSQITTKAPGLYEVIIGFYACEPPVVSFVMNEEEVFAVEGRQEWRTHSLGNVRGLTKTEYLALPARANFYIRYSGSSGEGFLHLRKL